MGGDVKGNDTSLPQNRFLDGSDESVVDTENELRPQGLVHIIPDA